MLPEIWGGSMWNSIHFVACGYPDKPSCKDKKQYCQFYASLANVLPCKGCSKSIKNIMQRLPIRKYLNSRKRLLYWTYLLHNAVNRKLKKTIKISWGVVCKKYIRLSYYPKKQKANCK